MCVWGGEGGGGRGERKKSGVRGQQQQREVSEEPGLDETDGTVAAATAGELQ